MSEASRWVWRVVGCLGVLACGGLALENLESYVRHRESGDQAGYALGMALLDFAFVPATSIALVLGAGRGLLPGTAAWNRWSLPRFGTAVLLMAGSVFFAALPIHAWRLELRDLPSGHEWTAGALADAGAEFATLAAFALLLAGCAAAMLWPGVVRSRWFKAVLGIVAAAGVTAIAVLVTASPSSAMLALPTAGLVVLVCRTLWAITRAAHGPPRAG